MNLDDLEAYFNHELEYLRNTRLEFAKVHPKVARALNLLADAPPDPHIEHLIQSVAFLTGRIQRRLDDDFGEIAGSLLSVLAPHFLAPIPSLCIAQLEADTNLSRASRAHRVSRGTDVFSRPVALNSQDARSGIPEGERCQFRTCYDVELWPVQVESAQLTAVRPEMQGPEGMRSVLRLRLSTLRKLQFRELRLKTLRFFVHSEADESRLAFRIFEYLLGGCEWAGYLKPASGTSAFVRLGGYIPAVECLSPAGSDRDEGLLSYDPRTPIGQRLLLEYFAFPQKFLFFDLCGLDQVISEVDGSTLDVLFFSAVPPPPESPGVKASMFRLGCTPLANLFAKTAEPIRLTHTHHEYLVVPDQYRRKHLEVYSVESVRGFTGVSRAQGEMIEYRPFYSTDHVGHDRGAFWYASRRSSPDRDVGTEVYLAFTNLNFDPTVPSSEYVDVETLCTNRNLPSRLPFGEEAESFEPLSGVSVRCLTQPTPSQQYALGRGIHWRLLSQLLVNVSSLTDAVQGLHVLREILSLYCSVTGATSRSPNALSDVGPMHQSEGVLAFSSRAIFARIVGEQGKVGVARGLEFNVELDPGKYPGNSAFIFASVLERFLASCVSINTFSKLSARLKGQKKEFKRWPPRAGNRSLP